MYEGVFSGGHMGKANLKDANLKDANLKDSVMKLYYTGGPRIITTG